MNDGQHASLDPATRLGEVGLRVADLDRAIGFYSGGAGLEVLQRDEARAVLGSRGVATLQLIHRPDLQSAPRGSAGLYHTAVLYQERSDLAAAVYAAASGTHGAFTGSADHLVSEAFYFDDPEGNGVELYWDRPRDQWRWVADAVAMDTLPLDPNAFIATHFTGAGTPAAPMGAPTTIGHVHLKVGDIAVARDFYVDKLGFDVTTAMGNSALFTSAGGYHHHVGMNVWESRGAGPRSESLGLDHFTVVVPDAAALALTAERLGAAGWHFGRGIAADGAEMLTMADPWGTEVRVTAERERATVTA